MQLRRPIIQKKELKKEDSGPVPKQTLTLKSNLSNPIRINLQNQNSLSKIPTSDQLIQKTYCNPQNIRLKFKQIFEQCGDEIISYLNKKDQTNFRAVNKIAFYMVQSYQVWNMMVFDSDQISIATTNDTNEKESFLKQSFYSKVGKSRPSTRENIESEQWLIKPLNYNSKVDNQLVFLKNKNTIEDNLLPDEELKQTITMWTLNLTNLEKCINISKVQTDSLMQEISLWSDHTKLLQDFKQEYQLEHVPKILKLLQQRSIIDVAFERKKTILSSLIDNLLSDFEKKQNYAKELQNSLKPIIQRLVTIKLADFNSEFQAELWQTIEKIQLKYEKFFIIRKEFFFLKLFNFTQKLFQINLGWSVDFQNFELNVTLLEQFQFFLTSLMKRHEFGEKKFNQNQTIHSQNEVLFANFNKAIQDLTKMLKLNKKLGDTQKDNLQIQQMFQEYKTNQFDQFQDKQQWSQIYKIWKEKYKNSKTKVDEPESSEGISFGFFQTRMNWSIQ